MSKNGLEAKKKTRSSEYMKQKIESLILEEELSGLIFNKDNQNNAGKFNMENLDRSKNDLSNSFKSLICLNNFGNRLLSEKKRNHQIKLIEKVPPIKFISNIDRSTVQSNNSLAKDSKMFMRPLNFQKKYSTFKEEKQWEQKCLLGKRKYSQFNDNTMRNPNINMNYIDKYHPRHQKSCFITDSEEELNCKQVCGVSEDRANLKDSNRCVFKKEDHLSQMNPNVISLSQNLYPPSSLELNKGLYINEKIS